MGLLKIDPFGENKKKAVETQPIHKSTEENTFSNINTITLDELMQMHEEEDKSGGFRMV